jgi:hypothetical protein
MSPRNATVAFAAPSPETRSVSVRPRASGSPAGSDSGGGALITGSGVAEGSGVGVSVGVEVAVGVAVFVGVDVAVGVAVLVGVGVASAPPTMPQPVIAQAAISDAAMNAEVRRRGGTATV